MTTLMYDSIQHYIIITSSSPLEYSWLWPNYIFSSTLPLVIRNTCINMLRWFCPRMPPTLDPSFPSSPLQSNPLLASSNPLLQLHVKDPTVSVHVCAHPPLFVAHSFTFVSVYKVYPTPWIIGANITLNYSQSYSYHIRRYAHINFKKLSQNVILFIPNLQAWEWGQLLTHVPTLVDIPGPVTAVWQVVPLNPTLQEHCPRLLHCWEIEIMICAI